MEGVVACVQKIKKIVAGMRAHAILQFVVF